MLCNRDLTPYWVRTVLVRNVLLDEHEDERFTSRIDCYHGEEGLGERLVKSNFKICYAAVYFGQDREAFSTANCTIENDKLSKSNVTVGLSIEKEVLRIGLTSDFVVVMKGILRKFKKSRQF